MKISEEYFDTEYQTIDIKKAKYIGDFAIRIWFKDGTEKLVDFKPFLIKSNHPSIKKYLDEKLFSKFVVTDGNLNWNNFDLIFPVSDLYEGRIGH